MAMSVYVVAPTTINKIITWLRHTSRRYPWFFQIADRFQVDMETSGWEQRLAKRMYVLNVAAVNQRYHESTVTPEISYTPYPYSSAVAAWKALGCWLYQCSEGDIPKTPLYQYFKELEQKTAVLIVESLPEYEKAEWG